MEAMLHPLGLDAAAQQHPLQQVPMTVLFVLVAMAQQRHRTPVRQLFDQPERELLAMVLDGPISFIHNAIGE